MAEQFFYLLYNSKHQRNSFSIMIEKKVPQVEPQNPYGIMDFQNFYWGTLVLHGNAEGEVIVEVRNPIVGSGSGETLQFRRYTNSRADETGISHTWLEEQARKNRTVTIYFVYPREGPRPRQTTIFTVYERGKKRITVFPQQTTSTLSE